MKKPLMITVLALAGLCCQAQTHVEKNIDVTGQSRLVLDLPFADEIGLSAWDEDKVQVQAAVTINDGEEDGIFALNSHTSSNTIYIAMDRDRWQDFSWQGMCNCKQTKISYQVYFPKTLQIDAKTISGSYSLDYYDRPLQLKSISGDIDLNVPAGHGVDFRVKTVSGEVYSDLDIDYPDGKDGLKQLVGINVHGRAFGGGPTLTMKTISGNIYLRNE